MALQIFGSSGGGAGGISQATADGRYASLLGVNDWRQHPEALALHYLDGQVAQTIVRPSTDTSMVSYWEVMHDAPNAYLFHLTQGPNMGAAAALIGLGVDNGGVGLFVNNKKTGVGIKITQNDTITDSLAHGLRVSQDSTVAPAVYFSQGAASASVKPVVQFLGTSTSGTPNVVEFLAQGTVTAWVKAATGQFRLGNRDTATTPLVIDTITGQVANLQEWKVNGATVGLVDKDGTMQAAGAVRAQGLGTVHLYNTSGTVDQRRFHLTAVAGGNFAIQARVDNGSSAGDVLVIAHATGNLTPKDGAGIVAGTTTGLKIGTSTTQKLGFFNATPVVRPTLPAAGAVTADDLRSALITLGLAA